MRAGRWTPRIVLLTLAVISIAAWDSLMGWPVPGLDENARALVHERDAELVGGTLRYSLMRGLLASDVRMKVRLQAGRALLTVPRAIVGLNRRKLVHGVTWCDDLRIERATISLWLYRRGLETEQEPLESANHIPLQRREPRFSPRRLRLDDADLAVHGPDGRRVLSLSDLSLVLEEPWLGTFVANPLEALYGAGTLRAGRLTRSGVTHTDLAGDIDIKGGKLSSAHLAFAGPEGSYHLAGVKLRLTSWPPTLHADLDANLQDTRYVLSRLGLPLLGAIGGRLQAKIEGPLTAARVRGSLSLATSPGMDGVPFLAEAGSLLLSSGRRPAARGAWKVPFTLEGSSLTVDGAHLPADAMDFYITGGIRAGACLLDVDILLPEQELAGELSPAVLRDLARGHGLVWIPIAVTGTPAAPRFEVRRVLPPSTRAELRSYLQANAVRHRLPTVFLP